MFAETPPACRFLSNKRGYEATFGRDLLDAGFDPRDVMDKSDLRGMVVPVVRSYLSRAFPLVLQIPGAPDAAVAKTEEDRREIEVRARPRGLAGRAASRSAAGSSTGSGSPSRRAARRR